MSAEIIRPKFPDRTYRPDKAKIWKALNLIDGDDSGGLFAAAVAGLRACQINQGCGNAQGACNSLAVSFFALGILLGASRSDAEDMLD